MLFKWQHFSLTYSLYEIKVEERLEDLLQNYVRRHQITFFLEGCLCHIQNISLANGCCLEFQDSITDTRMIIENPNSVCDLLLICCTQISSTQELLQEQLYHTLLIKCLSTLSALHTSLSYATLLFKRKMLVVFSPVNIFRTFSPHCLLQYMKYALQTWAARFSHVPTKARKTRHSWYEGCSQGLAAFLFS